MSDEERTDYPSAPDRSACTSHKAYPSKQMAKDVALRMNVQNSNGTGRKGFEGVVVVAYSCTRCGRYHVGRINT